MIVGSSSAETPEQVAFDHLCSLADEVGSRHNVDLGVLARARPQWPVWPQPALSALVGPPAQVAKSLDQRWLHRFEAAVALVNALSASLGGPVGGPSGLSLLIERSVMLRLQGSGTRSAGGSCQLVQAADGWLAINLAREADAELVPVWLEASKRDEAWDLISAVVPSRSVTDLVERAILLSLPVAALPAPDDIPRLCPPLRVERSEHRSSIESVPLVVDLSSLWAGPLCGWYLARAGARVLKVESTERPDPARLGTRAFYDRLNSPKEFRQVSLGQPDGVEELRALVSEADVVIEASRPRALEAFGIDAHEQVRNGTIWCSITGYGRELGNGQRVAFGDDAAAAGGLITFVRGAPWFIGDAAADPISGVTAALGALSLWGQGRAGMVDVSMAGAVGALTGGVPVRSVFT